MQIVAGVLVKYVNFGKGWRHRLFVLQNGVLRYYKVNILHVPKQAFKVWTMQVNQEIIMCYSKA